MIQMHEAFQQFIFEKQLLAPGEKTLVAASAGVDSTVLCHLFRQAGFLFEIAHCNFQLRGEASGGDELFVKKLAVQLGVAFHSARFGTTEFAEQHKISIQVAARTLRYDWLEEVRQTAACQHIATAHHLGDSIETVLFNFTKGCGIRGLHGILPKNGRIIRPLLFATKEQILGFAQQEKIDFREDASNLTVKYTRNKIRHEVVPVLEEVNPSFQKSAGETIERLREAEALYDFSLQKIRENVLEETGEGWQISIEKLRSSPAPSTVLYELLLPFGFNNDQVKQILQNTEHQPGKMFYSPTHRLLVDRLFLILSKEENVGKVIEVAAISSSPVRLPEGRLTLKLVEEPPAVFEKTDNTAWLDYDRLTFPLKLRRWQPGDVFQPLGMGGRHRKLQDFFSDLKLSRFEKEKIWLLESGGEIAWVTGMRLDERFKVSAMTKRCLVVTYESDSFADE
jgi:tRNA(Ile)-lysidine synthase